jgi:predicted NACHT family NTPase
MTGDLRFQLSEKGAEADDRMRVVDRVAKYEFQAKDPRQLVSNLINLSMSDELGRVIGADGLDPPADPAEPAAYLLGDVGRVFADSDGSLLILGAAGSGKSTLLRLLLADLLAEAQRTRSAPVAFILNLVSWSHNVSMTKWLQRELRNRYELPAEILDGIMAGGGIALLLDGLDSLRPYDRARCVRHGDQSVQGGTRRRPDRDHLPDLRI